MPPPQDNSWQLSGGSTPGPGNIPPPMASQIFWLFLTLLHECHPHTHPKERVQLTPLWWRYPRTWKYIPRYWAKCKMENNIKCMASQIFWLFLFTSTYVLPPPRAVNISLMEVLQGQEINCCWAKCMMGDCIKNIWLHRSSGNFFNTSTWMPPPWYLSGGGIPEPGNTPPLSKVYDRR